MLNEEKKMKKYSRILIGLTCALIFLTLVLIWLPIRQENVRKINEINMLLTELNSLVIELETNAEIIDGMLSCKEACINTTTMAFPIENLRESSHNPNLRNKYIKKLLILIYFDLNQKNNALLIRDDPKYKSKTIENLDQSLGNIKILIEEINVFKECIENEMELDSCGKNYTVEIGYAVPSPTTSK